MNVASSESKELLYTGSVKKLWRVGEEFCEFEFTDDYSVFDWGKMPNSLQGKGNALAELGAFFFKLLQEVGIRTHFVKQTAANRLLVKRYPVLQPEVQEQAGQRTYVYPKPQSVARFLPLEVVFRLGAPMGSSILERRKDLKADTFFEVPIVEFYTKLEPSDRLLTREEALSISYLSDGELKQIEENTLKVAGILKNHFYRQDLILWDGKLEWAMDADGPVLVDAIGPDELRITHKKSDAPLSKEFLRILYKKTLWAQELKKYKAAGFSWKEKMMAEGKRPPLLSEEGFACARALYPMLAKKIKGAQDAQSERQFEELLNRMNACVK